MSVQPVPSVIDEIVSSGHRNRLVDEAMRAGRPVVGITCSLVPEPLLSIGGMVPIRLRALGAEGSPMADTYLSSVCCTYPRCLLEEGLGGTLDDVSGFVFATSCDHLRRLHDNLAYLLEPAFNHIVDVPHKTDAAAVEWYAEELRTLAGRIADHFGLEITTDSLVEAMERHDRYYEALRRASELRRLDPTPISGSLFHKLIMAGQIAPTEMIAAAIDEAISNAQGSGRDRRGRRRRARVMVVGSQVLDPRYLELIEGVGCDVVADRFCGGSLPGLAPFDVDAVRDGADPFVIMAEHSLRRARHCPRMMEELPVRLEFVHEQVEAFGVDGVIVETMKFCDLWGFESGALVGDLRRRGVPVLRVEREHALSGEGQLRTRVQAFLESMGK